MIRKATPKDFPYILDLYKCGLDELGSNYQESLLLKKIVNSFHLAPCFLFEKDGIISGMAGFTVCTNSVNAEPIMSDYMVYIPPIARSTEVLGLLMKAAQDFALSHKMKLRVEFLTSGSFKVKARLLEKHGFDVAGVIGIFK